MYVSSSGMLFISLSFLGLLSNYWSLDCVYGTTTRTMNRDSRHITCISNPCYLFFLFSFWYLFYYLPWCIQPPPPLPSAIATIIGTWDMTMCLESLVFFFFFFWYIFSYYIIVASTYFDKSNHHHYHPQKQQQQQGLKMWQCVSGPLVCFLFIWYIFFSFYYSFNLPQCIWLPLPPPSKTTGLKTQHVSSTRYDFFFSFVILLC